MIVIDPRRTETADVADLHLPLRPGTDAFLLSAMIAMIIERHGQDSAWLAEHTEGFAEVAAAFAGVPVAQWVAHAEVEIHGQLTLGTRTVVILDEPGMTDDSGFLPLVPVTN